MSGRSAGLSIGNVFRNLKEYLQLIISRLSTGLLTLILTPLILRNANTTYYGLFSVISSFGLVLALMDFGVGNGVIKRVAAAHALHNDNEIRNLITSTLFLLMAIAIGVIATGFFLTPVIPWQSLIRIPHGYLPEFQKSMFIAFLGLGINIVGGLASKLNLALSNIKSVAIWNTFGFSVTSFSLLMLSSGKHPLEGLVFGQLAIPGIIGLLNLGIFMRRNPKYRPKNIPNLASMRKLLASGKLFMVLEVTTMMSFQLDSLIVGHYLEPKQVATLTTSWKLFSIPLVIMSSALTPLWTATARAQAKGDRAWIRRAFAYSTLLSTVITLPFSAIIIFAGKFGIIRWTHGQIQPSTRLIFASAIWLFIACLTLPFAMMLNGLHASRFLIVTAICMTFLNVTGSIFLTRAMKDPSGPLFGSIIAQTTCFLIPLFFWVRSRYFKHSTKTVELGVEVRRLNVLEDQVS